MSDTPLFEVTPVYCVDTNVIVSFMREDNDEPYGRDTFAPQWAVIEREIASGHMIAPMRVREELEAWVPQIPDLRRWLRDRPHMFRTMSQSQLAAAKRIVNEYPDYGSTPNYTGDLEVIALAQAEGLAVVTNERVRPHISPNRPKIPEVCARYGTECLSVPGFLRHAARAP